MPKQCIKCSNELNDTQRFCNRCGVPCAAGEKPRYFFGKAALAICLVIIGLLSASTVTFLVLFLDQLST
ncbi:MAG: hypothetical protein FWD35_06415 [Oscillospiraceae bacterium]|nr:hypothetical protein [Oscillospiraceae bacterium]